MLIDQRKLKLLYLTPARPDDHRHPQPNNQISPCENKVKPG